MSERKEFPTPPDQGDGYQSFVMRVGLRSPGSGGKPKLSIRVVHVNRDVVRHFSGTGAACNFIDAAIERFVLRPLQ